MGIAEGESNLGEDVEEPALRGGPCGSQWIQEVGLVQGNHPDQLRVRHVVEGKTPFIPKMSSAGDSRGQNFFEEVEPREVGGFNLKSRGCVGDG